MGKMAFIEINWHPDRRRLRGFGLAALAALAALGLWVWWRHSLFGFALGDRAAEVAAWALWAAAGACGVLAAAAPACLRPLYLALSLLGAPIGLVVSYVVLAIVYYGILTPIGLAMRLAGRDPLHRKFDRSAGTYWVPRGGAPEPKRYFRQF
jgi:hypothetical protein